MKIEDLVFLLGKTRKEIEEMLKENEIIELNLTEKNEAESIEKGEIEIMQ